MAELRAVILPSSGGQKYLKSGGEKQKPQRCGARCYYTGSKSPRLGTAARTWLDPRSVKVRRSSYSSRIASRANTPAIVRVDLLASRSPFTSSEESGHTAMRTSGNRVMPLAKSYAVVFEMKLTWTGLRYIWIGTYKTPAIIEQTSTQFPSKDRVGKFKTSHLRPSDSQSVPRQRQC